jgi:hypothetical protein
MNYLKQLFLIKKPFGKIEVQERLVNQWGKH